MIILSSSYKSTVSFNSTILFMQGDRSDLCTVAALDKSDLPDLPGVQTSNHSKVRMKKIKVSLIKKYYLVQYCVCHIWKLLHKTYTAVAVFKHRPRQGAEATAAAEPYYCIQGEMTNCFPNGG